MDRRTPGASLNRVDRWDAGQQALSAGGNPTFATVLKVARVLGLRIHFEAVA